LEIVGRGHFSPDLSLPDPVLTHLALNLLA